jgi:hypothetical protein
LREIQESTHPAPLCYCGGAGGAAVGELIPTNPEKGGPKKASGWVKEFSNVRGYRGVMSSRVFQARKVFGGGAATSVSCQKT